MKKIREFDAVVIGAGIFGLYAADFLASKGLKVAVIEKEKTIFNRASKINQSRIHRGYHYPRSIETAEKVAGYYHRFCDEYGFALLKPFESFYAISSKNSKINSDEFEKFCKKINIPLKQISASKFFKEGVVEKVFKVQEAGFDFTKLKEHFYRKLKRNHNIDLFCSAEVKTAKIKNSKYDVSLYNSPISFISPIVINATYNYVNEINNIFGFDSYDLKFELCEMLVCETSNNIVKNKGLIVMDGPFFSLMPFENTNLVSLYSVKHTPIDTNYKNGQFKKYYSLRNNKNVLGTTKNQEEMIKQAQEYLKSEIDLNYVSSIYEIRPILNSSEEDDSRPTVITKHSSKPYFFSILSGKISTIYDIPMAIDHLYK